MGMAKSSLRCSKNVIAGIPGIVLLPFLVINRLGGSLFQVKLTKIAVSPVWRLFFFFIIIHILKSKDVDLA